MRLRNALGQFISMKKGKKLRKNVEFRTARGGRVYPIRKSSGYRESKVRRHRGKQ